MVEPNNCAQAVEHFARRLRSHGTENAMHCPNCGNDNIAEAKFCTNCGTPLAAAASAAGAAQADGAPTAPAAYQQEGNAAEAAASAPSPAAGAAPQTDYQQQQPYAAPKYASPGFAAASQSAAEQNAGAYGTSTPGYGSPNGAAPGQPTSPYAGAAQQPGYSYGAPAQPGSYAPAGAPVYVVDNSDKTLRMVAFVFCLISTLISALAILPLIWMIPMTVHCWGIYKGTKPNTVLFGVCTLIFCSLVSGILLLISNKDQ